MHDGEIRFIKGQSIYLCVHVRAHVCECVLVRKEVFFQKQTPYVQNIRNANSNGPISKAFKETRQELVGDIIKNQIIYLSKIMPIENLHGKGKANDTQVSLSVTATRNIGAQCKCKCKKRSGVGTRDPARRTIRSICQMLQAKRNHRPTGMPNQIPTICDTNVKHKGSILVLPFPRYANWSLSPSFYVF